MMKISLKFSNFNFKSNISSVVCYRKLVYKHMALLSQGGGAYTVPSGTLCSKTRAKAVSGCVNVLRMKDCSFSRSLSPKSMLVERSKRGQHQLIVAASPPTDEASAAVAAEPLTREDLIAYLASGCKSKDKWRYFLFVMMYTAATLRLFYPKILSLQNRYRT